MGNTFVDGQEKIGMDSALDFVTVRNSEGRFVFMGERQNVKCFDRLKKISDRVFETLAGQSYKFLDKMPEPKEPEITITPEMRVRAEEAWRLHCMVQEAGTRAAASTPEPPKPMTFEEQLAHDWRFNLGGIRKEFVSQASYEAYCKAVRDGRTKVCGRG